MFRFPIYKIFILLKFVSSLVSCQSLSISNGIGIKGSDIKIQTSVTSLSTLPTIVKSNEDENFVLNKMRSGNSRNNYVEGSNISNEGESSIEGVPLNNQDSGINATENTRISNVVSIQQASSNPILFLFPLVSSYAAILKYDMISSFILGGLSDFISQRLEMRGMKRFYFDYRRLLIFSCVSGFYTAPVLHFLFLELPQLPIVNKLDGAKQALVMVLIDQTLGAVIVTTGLFFAFEAVSYA